MAAEAFTLVESSAPPDPADVLGLWRTPAPSPDVSFSTGDPVSDTPVWRIDLPAEPGLAVARLSAARAGAMRAVTRLPQAADQLFEVAADVAGRDSSRSGAELELSSWLQKPPDAVPDLTLGRNISVGTRMTERLKATAELSDRLVRWCAPVARVDTRLGERVLGRSAVTWGGEVCSVVLAVLHPRDVQLHSSAVSLVRLTRATILRVLGLALEGALLVAAAVALPGGPLLALPATFRFVNRVLAEARR